MAGLKGFTGSLPIPNLTFCSDFGSSAQSRGFLHSDLVEENRHLASYHAGMSNIRIVTSVIGRAQRSVGRASALPGLYKMTPVVQHDSPGRSYPARPVWLNLFKGGGQLEVFVAIGGAHRRYSYANNTDRASTSQLEGSIVRSTPPLVLPSIVVTPGGSS